MKKLLLIFLFISSFLNAATRVVDNNPSCIFFACYSCKAGFLPDNPHTTIQDAVTAANAGDTIEICSGTYDESVYVNKDNLIIKGVDGQSPDDVIVKKDGCEILNKTSKKFMKSKI